jgi:hypothetical protein
LCFTSDAYYSWWKCGVVCGSLMKREPLGGCAVSRRDLSRFRGGENIFSSTRRRDGGGGEIAGAFVGRAPACARPLRTFGSCRR